MKSQPIQRVGVFDSGLGGLTVLRALAKRCPSLDYIYLGDTARTPYGTKSAETVLQYARDCAHFLLSKNIDLLVVACNTVSSVALEEITREVRVPVIGTIEPAIQSCIQQLHSNSARIGIIGTPGTISSGSYQKKLKDIRPDLEVLSQACPLFVPLVEEGLFSGPIVDQVISHYLEPLRNKKIEALILGCTHYPLLQQALKNFFGSTVPLIECAEAIATQVFESESVKSPEPGTREFFVTDGVSRFNALAELLLEGEKVSSVKIEEL